MGSHRTGLLGHLLQHPLDQLLQAARSGSEEGPAWPPGFWHRDQPPAGSPPRSSGHLPQGGEFEAAELGRRPAFPVPSPAAPDSYAYEGGGLAPGRGTALRCPRPVPSPAETRVPAANWAHSAGTGTEQLGLWPGPAVSVVRPCAEWLVEAEAVRWEALLVSWPQTDLLWLENDPSADHTGHHFTDTPTSET